MRSEHDHLYLSRFSLNRFLFSYRLWTTNNVSGSVLLTYYDEIPIFATEYWILLLRQQPVRSRRSYLVSPSICENNEALSKNILQFFISSINSNLGAPCWPLSYECSYQLIVWVIVVLIMICFVQRMDQISKQPYTCYMLILFYIFSSSKTVQPVYSYINHIRRDRSTINGQLFLLFKLLSRTGWTEFSSWALYRWCWFETNNWDWFLYLSANSATSSCNYNSLRSLFSWVTEEGNSLTYCYSGNRVIIMIFLKLWFLKLKSLLTIELRWCR